MTESTTTTDHDTIRKWAEQRDGHPAKVDVSGDGGILRIDFGEPEDALKAISWDEFFEIFEDRKLAFLYQDRTSAARAASTSSFHAEGEASERRNGIEHPEPGTAAKGISVLGPGL